MVAIDKSGLHTLIDHLQTSKPLHTMAEVCHSISKEKGFWDKHKPEIKEAIEVLIEMSHPPRQPIIPKPGIQNYLMSRGFIYHVEDRGFFITDLGESVSAFASEINLEGALTRTPSETIALMHSELTEALEAYRDGNPLSEKIGDSGFKQDAEEFADLQIRLLDAVAAYGIDLDGAVAAKLERNIKRPKMHGRKF